MGKINKFLCKYFDVEEKGYVTIAGLIFWLFAYIFAASTIFVIFYSTYLFVSSGAFWNPQFEGSHDTLLGLGAMFAIIVLFIMAIFIVKLVMDFVINILKTKIAICERKTEYKRIESSLEE